MRKNTYSKILLAPIAALILAGCSSKLHNQSQEYDDIYFTKADRKKEAVIESTSTAPLSDTEEDFPIVDKVYSNEEYSPQYVDPALVEKFNNNNASATNYRPGLMVTDMNSLNFQRFESDFDQNYVEFNDLPMDWGKGYWSEIQFDNRVASDFQFRNAWYDYYYNGYEGSLNNYFERASYRQNFTANNNFYSPIVFRPRVSLSFGIGYRSFYDPFYNPFFNTFYDPFYDPFFNRGMSYYGFGNPFFASTTIIIGSSHWGSPNYRNRPFYRNYPFYPSVQENPINGGYENDRIVTRGPRNGRRVNASVQEDLMNGTSPRTRSEAQLNNVSLNASSSINDNRGRVTSSRTGSNGQVYKNRVDNIDNISNSSSLRSRTSSSAVTINSRNSRISSDDFSYTTKNKTRKSSDLRSRTSNTYAKPAQSSFDRTSRKSNSATSFNRIDYGSSNNSRNSYSRPATNYNRNSGSRSSGTIKRAAPSRNTTPVKRSTSSTRSTTVKKSTRSSNNSGRSNE